MMIDPQARYDLWKSDQQQFEGELARRRELEAESAGSAATPTTLHLPAGSKLRILWDAPLSEVVCDLGPARLDLEVMS